MAYQHRPPQPVIWINGWPAVGKHALAQCLTSLYGHDRAVLIDDREFSDQQRLPQNAQLSRHVLLGHNQRRRAASLSLAQAAQEPGSTVGLLPPHDFSGPTPGEVEKRQLEAELLVKQEACFRTYLHDPTDPAIAENIEPGVFNRVVIFTDCRADDESGRLGAQRYASRAAAAKRPFVPLYVECAAAEHMRRAAQSHRQYFNSKCKYVSDGCGGVVCTGSIVGTATDAIREMQGAADGRLYVFGDDQVPGLFVDVTKDEIHSIASSVMAYIDCVLDKRMDAVARRAKESAKRRPAGLRL